MAKIKKIDRKNFIGFRVSDNYKDFIEKQLLINEMSLNEYMNYLLRKEINENK